MAIVPIMERAVWTSWEVTMDSKQCTYCTKHIRSVGMLGYVGVR